MFKQFADSKMISEAREQSRGFVVWKEVLIFLAVFFITTIISSMILEVPLFLNMIETILFTGDVSEIMATAESFVNSEKYLLISLFTTVITTVGAIIFCRYIEKRKLRTMGFVRKNAVKEYVLGFGIGVGLFAAALLLCVAAGAAKVSFSGGNIGIILLFLVGYLIQGMSEEVLLRGYFMVSLGRKNSIGWAIIMSSVMFALLHIFNNGVHLIALVNLTLYGVLMALYMLCKGSIWGVCAIHSSWNFVQGNIFGVQVSGMPLCTSVFSTELSGNSLITGGCFGIEGSLIVTLVLLAGIAMILLTKRKKA